MIINTCESPLQRAGMLDLPGNPEDPRVLTFVEFGDAPFQIQRAYWLHPLVPGDVRGKHAHRETQQIMVAVSGAVRITLDDGTSHREFLLDDPARALWVPAGLWRVIVVQAAHSALLVLASTPYEEADYIREYDDYCRWAQQRFSLVAGT